MVDPFDPQFLEAEKKALKLTEISKMKAQVLSCETNATLISVNLRYIIYSMKRGQVRIIYQNGVEMFKLGSMTQSNILDLAINGCGNTSSKGTKGTTLMALDEEARVSIYLLDHIAPGTKSAAGKALSPEERTRRLELTFPKDADNRPLRVLGHPTDNQVFLTMHFGHVQVWNLARLTADVDISEASSDFTTFDAVELSSASLCATPSADSKPLKDFAVSVDGRCLLTLGGDGVTITAFHLTGGGAMARSAAGHMESLRVAQQMTLGAPASSLRTLGEPDGKSDAPQALVVGSQSGCRVELFLLSPRSAEPISLKPLQAVEVAVPSDAVPTASDGVPTESEEPVCRLDVNISKDMIILAYTRKPVVVVVPLAKDWQPTSGLPLPFAQRFITEDYTTLCVAMTCKSATTLDQTVLLYRSRNFLREKDGQPCCTVIVNEVEDRSLIERVAAEPLPAQAASTVEAVPCRSEAQMNGVGKGHAPEPAAAAPASAGASASALEAADGGAAAPAGGGGAAAAAAAGATDSTGDEDQDAEEPGDTAVAGLGASTAEGSGAPRGGGEAMDWGFVKHIAAGFVKGLEKRRGELADRIVQEVGAILKETPAGEAPRSAAADLAVLEQALAKLKEARAAQVAQEKSVQAAAKRATEAWCEASQGTIAGIMQRELGKVSDGIANSLAQQLSGSRKFCEAVARGVQKSGGTAAKMSLEAMRPARQLQETVGTALTEALNDSLGDAFKSELREHFEKELAPLLGKQIGEMLNNFRNEMAECLNGIATEHEEAAKRLGSELAPVVQAELQQVQRLASQHRDGVGSSMSEAQLDELSRAVQAEVVQPLQTRIKELTATVQALRAEAQELERRWQQTSASTASAVSSRRSVDWLGAPAPQETPQEIEARLARELEAAFDSGRVEEAFSKAVDQQVIARHEDFLGRLCGLVREPVDDWLSGGDPPPLSMRLKISLALALARQLEGGTLEPAAVATKANWIDELFYSYDINAPEVAETGSAALAQLVEALERAPPVGDEDVADRLRRLKRGVKQAVKFCEKK